MKVLSTLLETEVQLAALRENIRRMEQIRREAAQ